LVKSPESKKRGVQWTIVYTRQAVKDSKKLKRAGLKSGAEKLLAVLRQNPFQSPPPFEKLVGDLSGAYSRRINIQHRIVYQVLSELKIVKILRMWTYYE
jgi:Txe/YoeB family toxin of toxin-antitoxin system